MFGHDWEHGTAKVIDRNLVSSGGGETPDYKRQKVKLDKDDPSRHADPKAPERAAEAKFEAELGAAPGTTPDQVSPQAGSGVPTITINGKVFKGPMDKAELQQRLTEAGKSPDQD
jgi:hypothetical protein